MSNLEIPEANLSEHQPAGNSDTETDAAMAEAKRESPQGSATGLYEIDFSRLRMARASLDGAFPQR